MSSSVQGTGPRVSRAAARAISIYPAPREDRRPADPVVRQIVQFDRIQARFPRRFRRLELNSEERMNRPAHADAMILVGFTPVALLLERIGREPDRPRVGRVERSPIDLGAEGAIGQASPASPPLAVLAAQRA